MQNLKGKNGNTYFHCFFVTLSAKRGLEVEKLSLNQKDSLFFSSLIGNFFRLFKSIHSLLIFTYYVLIILASQQNLIFVIAWMLISYFCVHSSITFGKWIGVHWLKIEIQSFYCFLKWVFEIFQFRNVYKVFDELLQWIWC